MTRTGKPGYLFILIGTGLQLSAWLLIRPDRAGSTWTNGTAVEVWLGVEAVLAVAIGLFSPNQDAVFGAILGGWSLQMLHFLFLGEHYNDPLSGMGLVVQMFLAMAAAGIALVAHFLADRWRQRTRS
jgi:hypothetical protein